MITIRIPIHSFIDVITNSSTEVFINAHNKSVEMAKGILSTILKASGSKKNVEDIFDVSTELSSRWHNSLREHVIDMGIDAEEDTEEYEREIEERISNLDYTESESGLQNNLVIKVKNNDKNLTDEILKMFDIEAEYNG